MPLSQGLSPLQEIQSKEAIIQSPQIPQRWLWKRSLSIGTQVHSDPESSQNWQGAMRSMTRAYQYCEQTHFERCVHSENMSPVLTWCIYLGDEILGSADLVDIKG